MRPVASAAGRGRGDIRNDGQPEPEASLASVLGRVGRWRLMVERIEPKRATSVSVEGAASDNQPAGCVLKLETPDGLFHVALDGERARLAIASMQRYLDVLAATGNTQPLAMGGDGRRARRTTVH